MGGFLLTNLQIALHTCRADSLDRRGPRERLSAESRVKQRLERDHQNVGGGLGVVPMSTAAVVVVTLADVEVPVALLLVLFTLASGGAGGGGSGRHCHYQLGATAAQRNIGLKHAQQADYHDGCEFCPLTTANCVPTRSAVLAAS